MQFIERALARRRCSPHPRRPTQPPNLVRPRKGQPHDPGNQQLRLPDHRGRGPRRNPAHRPLGPETRAPTVLAVQRRAASHKAWPALAQALPDIRIIAPDLRAGAGATRCPRRTGCRPTRGPRAVLAALGTGPVVVVSAIRWAPSPPGPREPVPERVRSLVLVDGGLPLQVPADSATSRSSLPFLGPAAERLNATFASRRSTRSFWRQHPAFSTDWSPLVEEYGTTTSPARRRVLRPATRYQAMADDTAELHRGASLLKALEELRGETLVLRAPRACSTSQAAFTRPAIWMPGPRSCRVDRPRESRM